MTRSLYLGIAALMIVASPSRADDPQTQTMPPLFGNTLVYTNDVPADTLHKVYNADHTWVSWYPLGRPSRGISYKAPHHRGTWEFRGADTLCDSYHRSNIRPHVTVCQKMAIHHVGETWNDASGLSVTLLQGVQ